MLPSGIVTLTTDFGLTDGYVGVMKGVLLTRCPALKQIVDLTHEVPPQDVAAGAFQLAHAWRWFPAGTVHVAVVDPGVGSGRGILVARAEEHLFLAPDNGLLDPVLPSGAEVFRLDVERYSLPGRSRTFHGRDVFMPAAAALVLGADPAESGARIAGWKGKAFPLPDLAAGSGEVLVADHFGNLITNLPAAALASRPERGAAAAWRLEVGGRSLPVRGTYAEAAPGELLALVDSYGLIEIARRDGSAARELNLGPGSPVMLRQIP